MILAVAQSHYGEKHLHNKDSIYTSGNSIAHWLGLNSWVHIVQMQSEYNRDKLKLLLERN